MNNKVQIISRRSHVSEERGPTQKIPPVYAFRTVKVHGNQGVFRMVGRQVDKVILFPSKRGSKCGKMDKKEAPDAEALTPPRPAFCLFVYEVEPLRRKVGVAHGVQLIGGLAGQRRHFLAHVRQSCPEICRRPAAVGVVVQTDQVFFFHGEIHSSYLHFF